MNPFKTFVTFAKPSPVLHSHCLWKKGDEDEQWAQRAIEHLIKKLKKKKGALEDLEFSIANPHKRSKCVTIPRSLDGRLQVSHRKGLPHVIYCRVWRWPDLQSHHELRPIESCQYPFQSSRQQQANNAPQQEEVCINPYHYERIENPPIPPILVPRNPTFDHHHPMNHHHQHHHQQRFHPYAMHQQHSHHQSPHQFVNIQPPDPNNPNQGYLPINSVMPPPLPLNTYSPPSSECNFPQSPSQAYSPAPSSIGSIGPASPQYNSPGSPLSPSNYQPAPQSPPEDSRSKRSDAMEVDNNDAINSAAPEVTVVPFHAEPMWCKITYYELNVRIGDAFFGVPKVLTIDGFTGARKDQSRLSLGNLSNVSRNNTVENTRRHIGKGVQLSYIGGEVLVDCLSDCAMFVQSRLCNVQHGFHPTTVCKVPPNCSLKVFSLHHFAELLRETVKYGFEACFDLTKMCIIRLSFVKGWGAEYQRQDITSCPCWVEIALEEPLRWLDRVLTQIDPPENRISSQS